MIDPQAALIALFLGDATLRAEVQGQTEARIFGAPPGLSKESYNADTGIPYKSLVVQQNSIRVQPNAPICYPMFYLVAYGQEGIEAQQVMTKVHDVLYHVSGNLKGTVKCNMLIDDRWFMYSAQIQIGSPVIEPQSKWPVVYATVQAKFDSLRGA